MVLCVVVAVGGGRWLFVQHCVCFFVFPGGLPNCWLLLDGCGWLMMMGHSWRAVGCLGQAQIYACSD